MDKKEFFQTHKEYRDLFPTQEMYDDFLRFIDMNEEEKELYFKEDKSRIDAMSSEERERDWNNLINGTRLLIDFAKKEIPELTLGIQARKRNGLPAADFY